MRFIKTEKGYLDVYAVKSFLIPDEKTVYADAIPIKTFDTEFEAVTFLDDLILSLDGSSSNEFIHDFNAKLTKLQTDAHPIREKFCLFTNSVREELSHVED